MLSLELAGGPWQTVLPEGDHCWHHMEVFATRTRPDSIFLSQLGSQLFSEAD